MPLVEPVNQLVGGVGVVLDREGHRVILKREAEKTEGLEEASLDPHRLVMPAIGKGDRLGIGPRLGEAPTLHIVGEFHRLCGIDLPSPDEPHIGGHVEGVRMDIQIVDHRGPDTDFDDLGGVALRLLRGRRVLFLRRRVERKPHPGEENCQQQRQAAGVWAEHPRFFDTFPSCPQVPWRSTTLSEKPSERRNHSDP